MPSVSGVSDGVSETRERASEQPPNGCAKAVPRRGSERPPGPVVPRASAARFLPTTEAAAYCGFRTSGALRKAAMLGKVRPVGRRGGTGPLMWAVDDLNCFLRGELPSEEPERSGAPPQGVAHEQAVEMFKRTLVQPTPLPGVYRRKEGGHVVRGRVVDPTTGRTSEIWKVLPDAEAATALKWLEDEKARIRAGVVEAKRPKTRFADFAMKLRDEKIDRSRNS